jgi:hypothetical protein
MSSERSVWERLREDGEIQLNSPIELMRFTLTYKGDLKAQSKGNCRVDLKHAIRESLHKQLAELWQERPPLKRALAWYARFGAARLPPDSLVPLHAIPNDLQRAIAHLERTSRDQKQGILVEFQRNGFAFVPLATKAFDLVCELDILFLRAEPPGTLFTNIAGDLDNRLKTLLDALCVPKPEQLPSAWEPSETQKPFLCLLEDDKLVTAIRVESERLLDEPEESSRVELIVRVTMKTRRVTAVTLEIEGD